jgi:hypothetical protein
MQEHHALERRMKVFNSMTDYEREGHARPGAPRSTLTVKGVSDQDAGREVVADVWRAHRNAQRLHLWSVKPDRRLDTDSVTQCGSPRADREGEVWIGYSASGVNHETAPVSSSKCHGRITFFVREKSH